MHNGGVDWQHVLFGVVAMLGQYGSPQSSGTDAYIQADTATAGQSSNFAQGQHSSDCVSAENACAGHQRRFLAIVSKKGGVDEDALLSKLGTGLRIHITINLQTSYKQRLLNNHKKLCFFVAAVPTTTTQRLTMRTFWRSAVWMSIRPI